MGVQHDEEQQQDLQGRDLVVVRIDEYLRARGAAKPSAHTVAAYRRDLEAVLSEVAAVLGTCPDRVVLEELEVVVLRAAFAEFAACRAASSVVRAWSTWNGFFRFWVAEQVVSGNP
uniref:site-specific integrase n=1 Tax=Nocardiopsis salina TaxID=245836 RepID=UPI000477963F